MMQQWPKLVANHALQQKGGDAAMRPFWVVGQKKFTQSIRTHITEFLNINVNVIQQFLVLVRAASRMLVLKKNSKLTAYNTFEERTTLTNIYNIYCSN